MPQRNKPGLDWPTLKARYIAGESASALAHEFGVTRQGIAKRAKREGWWDFDRAAVATAAESRPVPVAPATVASQATAPAVPDKETPQWPTTELHPNDRFGNRTLENKAIALDMAQHGATYTAIAAAIGITPPALKQWRDSDPEFDAEIKAAMAADVMTTLNGVNGAILRGDARAAQWKLEKHPLVKDDYTNPRDGGGGPTIIVINVPRNAEQLEALQSTGRIGQAKVIEAEVTEVSG